MTRLDPLPLRDLTADQRTLRDSVTTSRGLRVDEGSPLPGPFEAWLRSPRAGLAAARLGESIGSAQVLPAAQRELVILVVAAHYRAGVVFLAHSRIARRAGIGTAIRGRSG
jgi:4-carboxymuconolactone decarboxylase